MDFYTTYKNRLKDLKEHAKALSVNKSEECWVKFPSKLKSQYNECCKKAAKAYHIYCDGRRRLEEKKQLLLQPCMSLPNPKELIECKQNKYETLLEDLKSLERKISQYHNQ